MFLHKISFRWTSVEKHTYPAPDFSVSLYIPPSIRPGCTVNQLIYLQIFTGFSLQASKVIFYEVQIRPRSSVFLKYVQVAAFGYTTRPHKEQIDKPDKRGGEAVRQLPAWLGNTPAGPPVRSPAWGNVCPPVGKEDFKHKVCATSTPLQLPLLLFPWALRGISEDHPRSHHAVNQSRLSSLCHRTLPASLFLPSLIYDSNMFPDKQMKAGCK